MHAERAVAPEAFPQSVLGIDQVLAPYGGLGSFGREDHDSHRFLSDDIRTLKNMATILPPIFFAVAAFLLSVVLSRIVALPGELHARAGAASPEEALQKTEA